MTGIQLLTKSNQNAAVREIANFRKKWSRLYRDHAGWDADRAERAELRASLRAEALSHAKRAAFIARSIINDDPVEGDNLVWREQAFMAYVAPSEVAKFHPPTVNRLSGSTLTTRLHFFAKELNSLSIDESTETLVNMMKRDSDLLEVIDLEP